MLSSNPKLTAGLACYLGGIGGGLYVLREALTHPYLMETPTYLLLFLIVAVIAVAIGSLLLEDYFDENWADHWNQDIEDSYHADKDDS